MYIIYCFLYFENFSYIFLITQIMKIIYLINILLHIYCSMLLKNLIYDKLFNYF